MSIGGLTFEHHDRVVYPAHGVGIVIGEEKQQVGESQLEVLVIFFETEKMTLRVPSQRAHAVGLRHLSSLNDLQKVVSILQSAPRPTTGTWSRRAQILEGKINTGKMSLIAEVVRDLHVNVEHPDRSYSERIIYESALHRLCAEYAAIKTVDTQQALQDILDHLTEKQAA